MSGVRIKSQRVLDAEKRLKDLDSEFGYDDLLLSVEQRLKIAHMHSSDVMNKNKLFNTGVVVNDRELHWRYCDQLCLLFFPDKNLIVD